MKQFFFCEGPPWYRDMSRAGRLPLPPCLTPFPLRPSSACSSQVLIVAEKPSVARSIAEFLSNGRMRTRRGIAKMCAVHEFFSRLGNERVQCRVTSVVGHLFGLDFADNRRRDESLLFDAQTVKKIEEGTQKCRVVEHLRVWWGTWFGLTPFCTEAPATYNH